MAKYLDENGLASVWSKFKSLLNSHINNRNNPHQLTKNQIGLNNVDNTSDLNKPLSTATSAALGQKLNYRDSFIGKADDVTSVGVCFVEAGTGNKSPDDKSAVTIYTRKGSGSNELWQSCRLGQSDYVRSKTAIGWSAWTETPDFTTGLKTKLDGVSAGAEVNQNAFSHVQVGGTTLSADQKVDVLTLAAGANVTLTPDAATDKVTISSTNTTYGLATTAADGLMAKGDKSKLDGIATNANNYVHPTTAGNKHIPAGGTTGQILLYSGDGTVTWSNAYYAVDPDSIFPVQSKAVYNHLEDFYAKKEDIVGMYKYKGSVADATKLPTTGQVTGDVYNIVAASVYGGPGANVAWDGTRWDSLGEIFQITSMTASEIDAICV